VSENGSTSEGFSLQLVGRGCERSDFTWQQPARSSKGGVNNGQEVVCANGAVWINEFHYDDAGNDNDEFVEIGCNNEVEVTGYKIFLYNGSNGISYNTAILSGVCSTASGDNFVVQAYSPQIVIQNGGPDGIALVDASDAVIEFISYEGSFTAEDGPAEGQTSVDIGVSENSSTSEGLSLQLVGRGCERSDFTWQQTACSSKGGANNGQEVACGYESEPTPNPAPTPNPTENSENAFFRSLFGTSLLGCFKWKS
jgi:hypothetical protein